MTTPTPVANSYITTVEEADAMVLTRPNSSAWTGASKSAALQEATRRIDSIPLRGKKYDLDTPQTREFPRTIDNTIVDLDTDGLTPKVPDIVKWAVLEEAIAILDISAPDSTLRRRLQQDGVASAGYSGTSETFIPGAGSRRCGLQSQQAYNYMRRYIGITV